MKKTLLLTAAIAGSLTLSAQKADSLSVNLQQVSITAARTKLYSPQARVLQVINKQEIEKLPVANIDELLETVSGIDIRNRGVGGTQADISIRGGSFDQVLILLNGVNITDPHTGHYNLDIPVELSDIQRIEILQGSAARIYGPNAFSGAINIITSQSDENFLALKAAAGSFNTFSENISGNLSFGNNVYWFLSLSHKSSDGHIANTDYDIKNVFYQMFVKYNKKKNLDIQFGYQQKNYGANSFYSLAYPNQFDHTQTIYYSMNFDYQFDTKWSTSLQIYAREHYDRFELFRGKNNAPAWYADHNYHLASTIGLKANASYTDNFGKISFGVDIHGESIKSTVLGKPVKDSIENPYDNVKFAYEDNRWLPTVFADYSVVLGKFFLSAGASGTFNKQFGNFVSGGVDIAYNINQNLKFFLSANNAVRLPTFTDLYYKSATQRANPDLKPEKSLTFEAGGKFENYNLKLNASAYYRLGENIIDWIKPPHADSIIWYSRNLTEVNAFGAEFSAKYAFDDFFIRNISFDYSFVNLNKQAENFDSKYALDYLKNKAVFGLQHKLFSEDYDDYQFSMQWRAGFYDRAGNYSDFATGAILEYKPYFTADMRLLFETKKLVINLDFNNFTNTQFVDFGGLAQPRFNFLAGVRMKL